MIYVGTSGYYFPGWKGIFYPSRIRNESMLSFYARHFPAVELNFTYYGIPHPSVFEKMIERTPEGFLFSAKLNGRITHERDTEAIYEFSESIAPLRESGRLCALLAQFPYSFSRSRRNMRYLRLLREMFPDDELVVEFRNSSWLRRRTFDFLKREGLGYCCVDEPQIPGLLPPTALATSRIAYVRFHSRNGRNWYGNNGQRYNYLFSRKELMEWTPKIESLTDEVEKVYIFFNNCHAGHAAVNATELQDLLYDLGYELPNMLRGVSRAAHHLQLAFSKD